MYEELIKSLRTCSKIDTDCIGCLKEGEIIYKFCWLELMSEAATAIEELQKLFEVLKKYIRLGESSAHETEYIEMMYVLEKYEKEDFCILKEAFFPEPPKEET